MNRYKHTLTTYQKTAVTALTPTVVLEFAGGLVRVSGAGLGCPDWPKCFGNWIPPVSAAGLPKGFDTHQFNILKTWTEYTNRLTGITTGLLITATGILSFGYRHYKPAVFYSSSFAFLMVLVEGWLGGSVVRSRLSEWLITAHLLLAITIMLALIYAIFKPTEQHWNIQLEDNKTQRRIFRIGLGLLGLILIQTMQGTLIRASVDNMTQLLPALNRDTLLLHTGLIVKIHRSFSWTIFLSGIGLSYLAWWKTESSLLKKKVLGLMIIIVLQIALGARLYYMAMPPALEVLHLLFGVTLIGCVYVLLLSTRSPSLKVQFRHNKANYKSIYNEI